MQKPAQLCHLPTEWNDMVVVAGCHRYVVLGLLLHHWAAVMSIVVLLHECCIKLTDGTTDVSSYTSLHTNQKALVLLARISCP